MQKHAGPARAPRLIGKLINQFVLLDGARIAQYQLGWHCGAEERVGATAPLTSQPRALLAKGYLGKGY
jgi:hypothetical protein